MDANQNLLRLRALLEVATRALQGLFLRTFAAKFPGVSAPYDQTLLPLLRRVNKDQREMLKGEVARWDVTLLCLVLQTSEWKPLLSKEEKKSLDLIQAARNFCSHFVGDNLSDLDFESHFARLDAALTQAKLCEPREIALIKSPPSDVEDRREAKQAAVALKEEGNRAFRASRFEEAFEFYSRGVLLGGLIDATMLSDLYGNRSTTQLKLDRVKEAVTDAQTAVRVSPLYHKSHYRLALAHHADDELALAIASLEQVVAFCDDGEKAKFRSLLDEWRDEKGRADRKEDMDLKYAGHRSKAEREKLAAQLGGGGIGTMANLGEMMKAFPQSDASMNGYLELAVAGQLMAEGKHKEAFTKLMIAASEYDNAEAMYNLGNYMTRGTGTKKDLPGGFEWIRRASRCPIPDEPKLLPFKLRAQGVAAATFSMGNFYNEGICVPVNPVAALEHWMRAADLHFASAWNTLGVCYENGSHGLSPNVDEASAFFLHAANDGDSTAMGNLACLNQRLGRWETALMWAKAAREHGNLCVVGVESFCAEQLEQHGETTSPEIDDVLKQLRFQPPSSTPTVFYGAMSTLAEFDEALRVYPSAFMKRLRDIRASFETLAREFDWNNLQFIAELLSSPHGLIELTSCLYELMSVADCEIARDKVFLQHVRVLLSAIPEESEAKLNRLHVDMILGAESVELGAHIARTERLVALYPTEFTFRFSLSCLLMFGGPQANFERSLEIALSLLSDLENTNDAREPKLGLLYHLGACYFKSSEKSKLMTSRCISFLERFLAVGEQDGHRKVSIAHYTLGYLALTQRGVDDPAWMRHLEAGKAADAKLPPCFRSESCTSRKMLDACVTLLKGPKRQPPPSSAASTGRFHRRTEKEKGWLDQLRKDSANRMQLLSGAHVRNTNKAPLESKLRPTDRDSELKPVSLELLLGPRKDQVFWGSSLLCVAVNEVSPGPSLQVIVEDDQRYPVLLSIYGFTEALVKDISIGTVMFIRNPYARAASDGNMMIRVDNLDTIEVLKSSQVSLCWCCLKSSCEQLSPCTRCKKAAYCSQACQVKGWEVYGHKFCCKREG